MFYILKLFIWCWRDGYTCASVKEAGVSYKQDTIFETMHIRGQYYRNNLIENEVGAAEVSIH